MAGLPRRGVLAGLAATAAAAVLPDGEAQAQLRQRNPYVRRAGEARGASADGRIVILDGEGILDADITVDILTERGYPAQAMNGGRPGEVTVYMDVQHGFGPYDQRDLNRGTVGAETIRNFDRLIGCPSGPVAALGTGPG